MNPKNILIIVLITLCGYFCFKVKLKDKQIYNLAIENQTLAADIKRQVDFKGRTIIYKYRSGEKVKREDYYLPPEGSVKILQDKKDELKIDIKNKGFIFKPFVSAFVNSNGAFDAALGARLLYWDRYGLGAAYAKEAGPIIVLDRRIDDILPILSNCSVMFYGGRKHFGLGAAVYF